MTSWATGSGSLTTPSLAMARWAGGLTAYPTKAIAAIVASAVDKQFMHTPLRLIQMTERGRQTAQRVVAMMRSRMVFLAAGGDHVGNIRQSQCVSHFSLK